MAATDRYSEPSPKDQEWVSYPEFEEILYASFTHDIPIRAITKKPGFHWFGYYDKYQTDPTDRFALGMETDFDFRSPGPEDRIRIGIIDLEDGDRWTEIGTTAAWGWQQGCMLQWRPGTMNEVMWNDRIDGRFATCLYNVSNGDKRIIPHPFYHVHPSGRYALGLDFARIQDMRPGYGYPGLRDKNKDVLRPFDSGIYLIDLDTGEYRFLLSVADIASLPYKGEEGNDDKHYFNHIAYNTTGDRFVFLNRWKSYTRRWPNFKTRMFTASADGSAVRMVTDDESISHFVWRDSSSLLLWADGAFRLYKDDGSGKSSVVLYATNGHQSYFSDRDWILADTYRDANSVQNLYLLHEPEKKVIPLARFYEPASYFNEWRCDLHPRILRSGRKVIIDSSHDTEAGRQMYILDLGGLV